MLGEHLNINQSETLFWGGPAHGEYKKLLGGMFYVPVFEALAPVFNLNSSEACTRPSMKVVRYNLHQFTWHWKGYWSGFVNDSFPCWFTHL